MSAHETVVNNALQTHWNIDASLTPLDGEFDLNFLAITADSQCYLVKYMREGCETAFVEMQCRALAYISQQGQVDSAGAVPVSKVIQAGSGQDYVTVTDEHEGLRVIWVLSFIHGTLYSAFRPRSDALDFALGLQLGQLHRALAGFDHPQLHRSFNWSLMQAGWIAKHVSRFENGDRQRMLIAILDEYQSLKPQLEQLPLMAIHNDVNDNNIVVRQALGQAPEIAGLIDFGDMCAGPRVCDLAIACAYVVLDHVEPGKAVSSLIRGYHQRQSLHANEIALLVPLIRLRLAVSVVTSSLLSAERPDDPYLVVSQAPAWRFLESDINSLWLTERARLACGLSVVPGAQRIDEFLSLRRGQFQSMLNLPVSDLSIVPLSVGECSVPRNPFALSETEAQSLSGSTPSLGSYGEPRLVYTSESFRTGAYQGSDRRSVHLGVDVFAAAGTRIKAVLPGIIRVVEHCDTHLDYGGLIVLEHQTDEGEHFFTLYGHLDPESVRHLSVGHRLEAGDDLACLGSPDCNGGWDPHLHLQIALSISGMGFNWPGVANPDDKELWCALCPNPAALLNLPDEKTAFNAISETVIRMERANHFAPNLALSYREPLMFMRGYRHHLFDQWGRTYLDAYNNVPHVGHGHPVIANVVAKQLRCLNTNTRYLHPAQSAFAEALLSTMPEELSVCYFVNSGSEANELALRLARAATGGKDMVTPDHGYHGNTTGAVDLSAYKFNAPGGIGQPDWVHLVDIPDVYRGRYRHGECDTASGYAGQIDAALKRIESSGGRLAGFIAETFPSVGGQIIPPEGYLRKVYDKIRAAGGVCIADEVQTGLGRLGEFYYGIEQQEVIPDIIVLGKPIGNGHPLGVVVTTQHIADSFAQGPEFFSTFGGSTLSCVIGKTVLDIVKQEGLQENASTMGKKLIAGLNELHQRHEVIGDVRGMGLFIGVELVSNRQSRTPASAHASHLVNRLRDKRVLTGLEGPDNNVLKIRPPLTIASADIDQILQTLDCIFDETVMMSGIS